MYEKMRDLAEKWHAGQFRDGKKGDVKVPYFEHPKMVVQNLLEWGEPESSAAIGIAWGHDLKEDTKVTEAEILAASCETVLNGILLLTHAKGTPKARYIQSIADSGDRNALLVKISDRIQNSRDFLQLEGALRAFRYLHDADCIFEAVQQLPQEMVRDRAITAWEELDEKLRGNARHEAIRGCLLGGAVGDALGAPAEFLPLSSIRKLYGADGITGYVEFDGEGAITDDTQMALFTAEGILRAHNPPRAGFCDCTAVMRNACWRWLKTQNGCIPGNVPENVLASGWLIREKQLFSSRAPGMTCLAALESGLYPARNNSKGCGTVMRMAPVGLSEEYPDMAYDSGCNYSRITHGHAAGITSGGAFAMLISELMTGKSLDRALDAVLAFLETQEDAAETAAALRKARAARRISELGDGWVAEEALAIGVFCALKHTWDFRAGVLEAVNIDGDSDSTGSITGNIIGVINGEKAIPEPWLSGLREREIVSQMADDLWTERKLGPDGYAAPEWQEKYPGF